MALKGRRFDTRESIIADSKKVLKNIPKDAFSKCFKSWEKRWKLCIDADLQTYQFIPKGKLITSAVRPHRQTIYFSTHLSIHHQTCRSNLPETVSLLSFFRVNWPFRTWTSNPYGRTRLPVASDPMIWQQICLAGMEETWRWQGNSAWEQ
ncbi:hypothetical protein LAZ67_3002419 [Cordylochernes scorpioides]|uniref:Uncharacterized protein n=1 Tax=Cordylochernes scorpioides TaxID=51811 RepID=A0ABY6K7S4_9ARAC|nr:hypothetical protein LAZ67_3002419 [Cordylochernes scorpioides]